MTSPRTTTASLVDAIEVALGSLEDRLAGLRDDEYLWEPVPHMWSVRGDGAAILVDTAEDDPAPAPATTIAWRMWHIAVDALDSYSARLFGRTGTGLTGGNWTLHATTAIGLVHDAGVVFRDGVNSWDADTLAHPLGSTWGPYAESTHLDLGLHALREVNHHGAEIGVLRDLYEWTAR